MASDNQENVTFLKRVGEWLKGTLGRTVNAVINTAKDAKRLGEEDPRRIVHSLKVGLAITVVSLFYYFDFLYQGFGVNAMWAVMTVVVVFEFSVGATLGKGVNRGIATLLGGGLGVVAHRLASFAGEKPESIILGLSVFLIASMTTFIRFFPKMKARYDYGLLIFILTFSLISVSGYRQDEVLDMAHRRLSTVLIGGLATIFICIFICPTWAGEDLHKLTAANIEKLGAFLEGFGRVYFPEPNEVNLENKMPKDEYKSVLNSKAIEDTLVNFAKWEPRHGKFRYRHPWDQYLKIGSLTRECAFKIDSLNAYLRSDVQTPLEIRAKIKEPCVKMSSECSYALRELAVGIEKMTRSLTADIHVVKAKASAKRLKAQLKTGLWPDTDLLDIVPAVTVASLLVEIVSCTVKIADSVYELASLSKFKTPDAKMTKQLSLERVVSRTVSIEGSHNVNIIVE
ncbi:aluminum-activated malate transporter 1 [Striga asiatica]|uniref:Aluminum-activated malate transporter 1 n=1 Tax=Striga asiatica TaxID=4170 RepID=A0A5A7PV08_STRAF|nr:aluminum-activated malate transporter 1 [Striga asiatica]